jgi:hypothetical protein
MFAGDVAYVVTTKEQVRTLSLFGHEEPEATRIVIAGGGNIGLYVAQALEQRQINTRRAKSSSRSKERAVSRLPTSCAARWCCTAAHSTRRLLMKPTSRTPT